MLYNAPVAGTESPRAGDFISSEDVYGFRSRDQVYLDAINDGATSLVAGSVLGKKTIGTSGTFANAAGNTGNGTCGTITLSQGAINGVYEAVCILAGATAKFELSNPSGVVIGVVTVGTAFSGSGLGFTILTGGTNYAVGDIFTITVGNATFARGTDTGNFTCGAITVFPGFVPGTYQGVMTDATHFTLTAPDGTILPAGVFGTQYNSGGLQFTLTAGGTAAVAGDTFTIVTNEGDGNYAAINFSASDGTQYPAGILIFGQYLGGSSNVKAAIISRAAEVKKDLLAWPSGATDDQVRQAITQLATIGIIVRGDLV